MLSTLKTTAPTKSRCPQSKAWVFTLNNPGATSPEAILGSLSTYGVFQSEIAPTTDMPHLQGYVVFKSRIGLNRLKQFMPTAHWEVRKGTHLQAKDYCTKEQTRVPGTTPTEWGTDPDPRPGQRNDLGSIQDKVRSGSTLLEIADHDFKTFLKYSRSLQLYKGLVQASRSRVQPHISIFWGITGAGKSHHALHLGGKDAYWYIPQTNHRWWDGYDGQKTVIMDEFYGQGYPFKQLLRLWDKYPLQVENKGSTTYMLAERFIVTSNRSPDQWYKELFNTDPDCWDQLERRISNIVYFEGRDIPPTVIKGELPPLPTDEKLLPQIPALDDQESSFDISDVYSPHFATPPTAVSGALPPRETEADLEEDSGFPKPDEVTCSRLDEELMLKEIAQRNLKLMRKLQKRNPLTTPDCVIPFRTLAEQWSEEELTSDEETSTTEELEPISPVAIGLKRSSTYVDCSPSPPRKRAKITRTDSPPCTQCRMVHCFCSM